MLKTDTAVAKQLGDATGLEIRHVVETPLPIGESFTARVKSTSAGKVSNSIEQSFYVDDPPVEGVHFLNVGKTSAELKWAKGQLEN